MSASALSRPWRCTWIFGESFLGTEKAAQDLGCHVLLGTLSGHQVSDIPEGQPIYQLPGMSAL